MSSPIRPLETARLRLRLPEQADARRIYDAYGTDAEVTRYLSWRPHTDRASAEAHMKQRLADMKRGSELGWMIEHNNDNTSLVFLIVACACFIGATISLFIRR